MPHIFGHDVTAYRGRSTQHDQHCNQHLMGEAQVDGKGQEKQWLDDKLDGRTNHGGPYLLQCAAPLEAGTQTDQGKGGGKA